MGSFYANLTVLNASGDDVVAALPRRTALVGVAGGAVLVFPADESSGWLAIGAQLSAALTAGVVGVGVHDDDILSLVVWADGEAVGTVEVPDPAEHFGIDAADLEGLDLAALGVPDEITTLAEAPDWDADHVVARLGRGDSEQLRQALAGDFVFASERHAQVAEALGLPGASVGWGYKYLTHDAERYEGGPLIEVP